MKPRRQASKRRIASIWVLIWPWYVSIVQIKEEEEKGKEKEKRKLDEVVETI